MKDRPKFRLADEESKDVRATLPQAYYYNKRLGGIRKD